MVKRNTGLPILTDIHETNQAAPVASVADIVQIPGEVMFVTYTFYIPDSLAINRSYPLYIVVSPNQSMRLMLSCTHQRLQLSSAVKRIC